MRLPNALLGVLAGAGCAAVIACSARQSMTSAVAPQMAGSQPPQHAAIDDYDRKLTAARDQLGLPAPAAPVAPLAGSPASPVVDMAVGPTSANDPTCHPAKTDTCSDTCTLADSICDSAAHICELAKQLPGDAWADGKCSSGEATCTAAHARCCGCQ